MKKLLCLTLALLMLAGLCGCGGKEEAPASAPAGEVAQTNYAEPQANLNPTFINWGSRTGSLVSSDPWYPNGKLGEDYIYFDFGESSSGCVYYRFSGGQQTGYAACELTKKNHLVTEGEGTKVDIVFHDEFHAYDFETQTWYVRANPDFMKSLFVDRSFVEKNDKGNTITFNADGTAMEVYQGVEYAGTWAIINATTVRFTEGEGDKQYEYDFELVINGQNQLDGLNEYGNRMFVYTK